MGKPELLGPILKMMLESYGPEVVLDELGQLLPWELRETVGRGWVMSGQAHRIAAFEGVPFPITGPPNQRPTNDEEG